MYKFQNQNNFLARPVSDFGDLLNHVESENERISTKGKAGFVEIVDTETGQIISLTFPFKSDLVAFLEDKFDMEEESMMAEAPKKEQSSGFFSMFTEEVEETESKTVGIEIKGATEEVNLKTNILGKSDAEVASQTSFQHAVVDSSLKTIQYGKLSQKLVGDYTEDAEILRQKLFSEIRQKGVAIIQKELDEFKKQLEQKQSIYQSLLENVKTSDDINGLIVTAEEILSLKVAYDKRIAQVS